MNFNKKQIKYAREAPFSNFLKSFVRFMEPKHADFLIENRHQAQ